MRRGRNTLAKAVVGICFLYAVYLLYTSNTSRIEKHEVIADERDIDHMIKRVRAGPIGTEEKEDKGDFEQLDEPDNDLEVQINFNRI